MSTPVTVPEDVAAKVKPGHRFDVDPPGGLSAVSRWTCLDCGDAVLSSGGVIYGSATAETCAEGRAASERVRVMLDRRSACPPCAACAPRCGCHGSPECPQAGVA